VQHLGIRRQIAMRDHRALRPSRGAGGVKQGGKVVRGAPDGRVPRALPIGEISE
jgi:hypothetical protein